MGKLFVFYGPSSAGKSSIQKALTTTDFPRIITSTTRLRRVGEVDGVDYIFMTIELFEQYISNGDFVEWTRYNGEYYGTQQNEIGKIHTENRHAHIILDLAGVISLKRLYSNIIAIYIGANLESIKRRLLERTSSSEEVAWRLEKAEAEELGSPYIQYADLVIWNNDDTNLDGTIQHIKSWLEQF